MKLVAKVFERIVYKTPLKRVLHFVFDLNRVVTFSSYR